MLNAVVPGFQASLEIITNELQSFVCLCRAAIVYLKNPSDAKAAVEDLNGRSLQGHTVQVVQLCRPALAEPTLSDQSCSTSETAGDGLETKGVTYSLSHGVSMSGRHFRNFAVSRTINFSVTGIFLNCTTFDFQFQTLNIIHMYVFDSGAAL